jgi:hypothetical protein
MVPIYKLFLGLEVKILVVTLIIDNEARLNFSKIQ